MRDCERFHSQFDTAPTLQAYRATLPWLRAQVSYGGRAYELVRSRCPYPRARWAYSKLATRLTPRRAASRRHACHPTRAAGAGALPPTAAADAAAVSRIGGLPRTLPRHGSRLRPSSIGFRHRNPVGLALGEGGQQVDDPLMVRVRQRQHEDVPIALCV